MTNIRIASSPIVVALVSTSKQYAWVSRPGPSSLSRNRYTTGLPGLVQGHTKCFRDLSTQKFFSRSLDDKSFYPGQKVQVEIVSFGPLGASADVIGLSHDENETLLPPSEEPYGRGLILQKEIAYFREARNNVDVLRGEVLPAYIQNIREDGKLDVGLREFGGKAKAQGVGGTILDQLEMAGGVLPVGDKSAPEDIAKFFPGVSKTTFKKAVGALYKQGLIQPGPKSIRLAGTIRN